MATPPDTNASPHNADSPTNVTESFKKWKGKAPAATADEELQNYPLDRLQAEIDRRSSIQRPSPVQLSIPEHFPDNILNHEDFHVSLTLQQQFDDKQEGQASEILRVPLHKSAWNLFRSLCSPLSGGSKSRVSTPDSRPSIVETRKPEQAAELVASAATGSHNQTDDTKHPKQSETTTNAVAESHNQTDDMEHPKQSETTANAVAGSHTQTDDTKHPKHPKQSETTANAAAGSHTQTDDTKPPKHPKQTETTANAVAGSHTQTDDTKHPKHSETTANAVAGSHTQTDDTKPPKHPKHSETTANAATESNAWVGNDEAHARLVSDLIADMTRFRYIKEAKQWIDISVEPACLQEVQRDDRLRRVFNDIAPGPKIEE